MGNTPQTEHCLLSEAESDRDSARDREKTERHSEMPWEGKMVLTDPAQNW